jgi:hypothetical protein
LAGGDPSSLPPPIDPRRSDVNISPSTNISHAFTSVTYHTQIPSFNNEIKFELPPNLTDNWQVLFAFYHLSCNVANIDPQTAQKNSKSRLLSLLG